MTLAVSYFAYGLPVVVGDALVTSPLSDGRVDRFDTPIYENVNREGRYLTATALVQKVVRVSPSLVLAWAGSQIAARSVISDILERAESLSPMLLKQMLDERRGEAGVELYLTGFVAGLLASGDGEVLHFQWDSNAGFLSDDAELTGFHTCYAGGSAAADFIAAHQHDRKVASSSQAIDPLYRAFSLITLLSGKQMRIGEGLDSGYGGAFEVASMRGGQFDKVNNVAYHFLEAYAIGDGDIHVDFYATLKLDYVDDYLVIQKIVFGPDNLQSDGISRFIIPPVYKNKVTRESDISRISSSPFGSIDAPINGFYVHMPQLPKGQNLGIVRHAPQPGDPMIVRYDPSRGCQNLGPHVIEIIGERLSVARKRQ